MSGCQIFSRGSLSVYLRAMDIRTGFRQSGLGREGGRAAVESYTELKTVLLPFTDEMM